MNLHCHLTVRVLKVLCEVFPFPKQHKMFKERVFIYPYPAHHFGTYLLIHFRDLLLFNEIILTCKLSSISYILFLSAASGHHDFLSTIIMGTDVHIWLGSLWNHDGNGNTKDNIG